MFNIGSYRLHSRVLLAPMAGVSDAPFRHICRDMGAALTTTEMLTADTRLWHSRKSSLRLRDSDGESKGKSVGADVNQDRRDARQTIPKSVQIAGSEPQAMANAARACVEQGAQIVDINMGCPAKKVCNKAAGSALLRDEKLVTDILHAVTNAVTVPVTLKIRTGWCPASKNGTTIARIAEDAGIAALTVHGRTRACRYSVAAEYDTIAAIVDAVQIPIVANGDIDSPQKARTVLQQTGAQGVMVGRAAQGQPWLIRAIDRYLERGRHTAAPHLTSIADLMGRHLQALYRFYGDYLGVRIARKHIKWYLCNLPVQSQGAEPNEQREFLAVVNKLEEPAQQHAHVQQYLERLITREEIAA